LPFSSLVYVGDPSVVAGCPNTSRNRGSVDLRCLKWHFDALIARACSNPAPDCCGRCKSNNDERDADP